MVGARADHLGDRGGAGDPLAGDDPVARFEGVDQSQLNRVHAECICQAVHLGLMGEAGLDTAEAPHGPARRVVGAHSHALYLCAVHPVGADGEAGGVGQYRAAGRGVGSAVEEQPGFDAHQGAVSAGVVAIPHAGRVTVNVAVKTLGSGVGHLDRTAGVEGQQAEVDMQAYVLPSAEGSPDPGQGKSHCFGLEAQAGRHLVAVGVQPLGRDVQVDPTSIVGDGQAGLCTQRSLVLHADLVGPFDHHVADGLLGTVAELDSADQVSVGMDGRGLLGELWVDEGLELPVVDDDGVEGSADGVGVVGGHYRYRLALVADYPVGQHRLVSVFEAVVEGAGYVLPGKRGVDTGHGQRPRDVHREDPGRRIGGP